MSESVPGSTERTPGPEPESQSPIKPDSPKAAEKQKELESSKKETPSQKTESSDKSNAEVSEPGPTDSNDTRTELPNAAVVDYLFTPSAADPFTQAKIPVTGQRTGPIHSIIDTAVELFQPAAADDDNA